MFVRVRDIQIRLMVHVVYIWLQIPIILELVYWSSTQERCPSLTEQAYTDKSLQYGCQLPEAYHCQLDYESSKLLEGCYVKKWIEKGHYMSLATGDVTAVPCPNNHFLENGFYSDEGITICEYKTLCINPGQVICDDGTTYRDRTCKCDVSYNFRTTHNKLCTTQHEGNSYCIWMDCGKNKQLSNATAKGACVKCQSDLYHPRETLYGRAYRCDPPVNATTVPSSTEEETTNTTAKSTLEPANSNIKEIIGGVVGGGGGAIALAIVVCIWYRKSKLCQDRCQYMCRYVRSGKDSKGGEQKTGHASENEPAKEQFLDPERGQNDTGQIDDVHDLNETRRTQQRANGYSVIPQKEEEIALKAVEKNFELMKGVTGGVYVLKADNVHVNVFQGCPTDKHPEGRTEFPSNESDSDINPSQNSSRSNSSSDITHSSPS